MRKKELEAVGFEPGTSIFQLTHSILKGLIDSFFLQWINYLEIELIFLRRVEFNKKVGKKRIGGGGVRTTDLGLGRNRWY